MSFEKIIGNNKIKEDLQEIINTENISHSYMFVGSEGIGKKMIAEEFAKEILCLSENKQTCENCNSCVKFISGNNPDFEEIVPDGLSIKIAQIRQMQENVYQKPIVSSKKIFIIDNAEKMTEEAQNSLLKTLEEPPEYIVIILITSNENKMLNTVKSRCVRISFQPLTTEEIQKFISINHIEINSKNIIEMCNGSIGKLSKIKDNIDEYTQVEKTVDELLKGKMKNLVQMMNEFETLYKSKEIIQDLIDYITVLVYKYISDNKDYRSKLLNIIKHIEIAKTRLNSNTNYDMTIDNLLIKIWEELDENNSRN